MIDHHEMREMLTAVAMQVADPDELLVVNAHLADCAECRAELEVIRDASNAFALAVPMEAPPASLRKSVLAAAFAAESASASEVQPEVVSTPSPVVQLAPRRARLFRAWAAPALAVAASLVLAFVAVDLSNQKSELEQSLAATKAELRDTKSDAARSDTMRSLVGDQTISLDSGGPLAGTDAFVALKKGSNVGVLVMRHVPKPPHDHAWQTWIQHTDGSQESVDILTAGSEVVLIPIELKDGKLDTEAVMITTEPMAGSASPTGAPIAQAQLV